MISLHLLVKDEEKLIGALLEYLMAWVEEIIVIDTGSTDKTLTIASQYTHKVYSAALNHDFAAARNYGLGFVTKPMVFQVDADEWPTEELMNHIHASKPFDGAMMVRRENLVGGQPIGDHTYEWHPRFFSKDYRFVGRIHEKLNVAPCRTTFAPESALLLHHKSRERQQAQNERYMEWEEQRRLVCK